MTEINRDTVLLGTSGVYFRRLASWRICRFAQRNRLPHLTLSAMLFWDNMAVSNAKRASLKAWFLCISGISANLSGPDFVSPKTRDDFSVANRFCPGRGSSDGAYTGTQGVHNHRTSCCYRNHCDPFLAAAARAARGAGDSSLHVVHLIKPAAARRRDDTVPARLGPLSSAPVKV